jgi:dihydrofolate reductase
MNMIAAVDSLGGIGMNGNMLYRIPEDLRYFKQMTYGKVVVMGHGTLKSLPDAIPLAGRTNIVLTGNTDLSVNDCILCHSLNDLRKATSPYESDDVFVIGGESVYAQLMDYCAKAYITKIHTSMPADRFFPSIESKANWKLVRESEMKKYKGIHFSFREYVNQEIRALS